MGRDSIHKKSSKQKGVEIWEKTVQIVIFMTEKKYPKKIISFMICIMRLVLVIKKLYDEFKN